MTRGELRAVRATVTTRKIFEALQTMDRLWTMRMRPGMDPDHLPTLGETNRARLLAIRDRVDKILNADTAAIS